MPRLDSEKGKNCAALAVSLPLFNTPQPHPVWVSHSWSSSLTCTNIPERTAKHDPHNTYITDITSITDDTDRPHDGTHSRQQHPNTRWAIVVIPTRLQLVKMRQPTLNILTKIHSFNKSETFWPKCPSVRLEKWRLLTLISRIAWSM